MTKGKGVKIGLKDLHYAILQEDPAPGQGLAVYGLPVRVPGAISANVNPNASNATLFADDGPYDSATTTGEITVELNLADVPLPVQAVLLGNTYEGGVLVNKSGDVPPWIALGFRSLKSNGKYRFTWLAKGKFNLPEDNNETKGDSVNFNTPTMSGAFVRRDCDEEWRRQIDEDDLDFVKTMADNWFNSPYGAAADPTPLTMDTVVPAEGASAVARGTSVVWTFNKALALSTATKSNFMILDADNKLVTGALTINASRTQVTFTPTAQLASAKLHTAVVSAGVKAADGKDLTNPSVSTFTTV